MKKKIDFPPYTEAEIREITEDGSILCDLRGPALAPQGKAFSDTGILFPPGSEILSLTPAEREAFEQRRTE